MQDDLPGPWLTYAQAFSWIKLRHDEWVRAGDPGFKGPAMMIWRATGKSSKSGKPRFRRNEFQRTTPIKWFSALRFALRPDIRVVKDLESDKAVEGELLDALAIGKVKCEAEIDGVRRPLGPEMFTGPERAELQYTMEPER